MTPVDTPGNEAGTPRTTGQDDPTVIDQRLHLGTGFLAAERNWVVRRLSALGPRLRSFPDSQVELEISLKERQGHGQQVTLECWINRNPRLHLVTTSTAAELSAALSEVRDDLIRQVDDAKTRTEPHGNHTRRPIRPA